MGEKFAITIAEKTLLNNSYCECGANKQIADHIISQCPAFGRRREYLV